eukprot:6492482-Amphidinium_carterae.2
MGRQETASAKWRTDAAAWEKKHGVDLGNGWWQQHSHECRGLVATARQQALINAAVAERNSLALASDVYVDVSQSLSRRPWSETLRAMTTSTDLFSIKRKRAIVAVETLQLLGFPKPSQCSPSVLRDLLGECMAPPTVALATLAVLAELAEQQA